MVNIASLSRARMQRFDGAFLTSAFTWRVTASCRDLILEIGKQPVKRSKASLFLKVLLEPLSFARMFYVVCAA